MKNRLLIACLLLCPLFSFAQKDSIKAIPHISIGFISISGGYELPEIGNILGKGVPGYNSALSPLVVITTQIPFDSANFGLIAVRLSCTHYPAIPIIETYWPPGTNQNTFYISSFNVMLGPYYSFHKKRFAFDTRLLIGFSTIDKQVAGHTFFWFCLGLSSDLRLRLSKSLSAILNLDFISSMIGGSLGICYNLAK